jgi:hypothetical protein
MGTCHAGGRMREPAELRTTEDAGRSLPSHGPDWDAAIAAGIDVTMIEANLRRRPCERLRRMEAANRFSVETELQAILDRLHNPGWRG